MFPTHGHNCLAEQYMELMLDFFAKHRRAPNP